MGGPDPVGNMRLKLALQKAKENNIPKDNIKRAIQKGAGATEGQNYEEIVYEGYGPAGVAVTVNVLTDNRNRAAADVRHEFSKSGGNLGATGCVSWMFHNTGLFVVARDKADEDQIMEVAIEAGADDVKVSEEDYEIITTPEAFDAVEKALADNNIETDHASITMIPENTIKLTGEDAEKWNASSTPSMTSTTSRTCTITQNFRKTKNKTSKTAPLPHSQESGRRCFCVWDFL
jgi:TIGR01033: DNA-binding regulatory protein, YebC/PmpR family